MTKLSLTVKGSKLVAARAAANRGIGFAFVREVKRHGSCETVGLTGTEQRDRVARWFAEGSTQAPFPEGTLLLYMELD